MRTIRWHLHVNNKNAKTKKENNGLIPRWIGMILDPSKKLIFYNRKLRNVYPLKKLKE